MQFKSARGKRTLKLAAVEMRTLADAHNIVEEIVPLVGRGHPLYQSLREASARLFQIRAALPDLDLNQLAKAADEQQEPSNEPITEAAPATNGRAKTNKEAVAP